MKYSKILFAFFFALSFENSVHAMIEPKEDRIPLIKEIFSQEKLNALLLYAVKGDAGDIGGMPRDASKLDLKNPNPYQLALVLIAAQANVNVRDLRGMAPLHIAAQKNDPIMLQLLVDNGADINAVRDSAHITEQQTPTFLALFNGNQEAFDFLSSRGGR